VAILPAEPCPEGGEAKKAGRAPLLHLTFFNSTSISSPTTLIFSFPIAVMPGTAVSFEPLPRAEGSVEVSHAGYTVIGSVNGPMEVQRRDELATEAAIEVNVRPSAGIGSMYFRLTSCHQSR
jgi:hypothetical protein